MEVGTSYARTRRPNCCHMVHLKVIFTLKSGLDQNRSVPWGWGEWLGRGPKTRKPPASSYQHPLFQPLISASEAPSSIIAPPET